MHELPEGMNRLRASCLEYPVHGERDASMITWFERPSLRSRVWTIRDMVRFPLSLLIVHRVLLGIPDTPFSLVGLPYPQLCPGYSRHDLLVIVDALGCSWVFQALSLYQDYPV